MGRNGNKAEERAGQLRQAIGKALLKAPQTQNAIVTLLAHELGATPEETKGVLDALGREECFTWAKKVGGKMQLTEKGRAAFTPAEVLPGLEALTGEQILGALTEHLRKEPQGEDDLVLWTRARFRCSTEQAELLVQTLRSSPAIVERFGKLRVVSDNPQLPGEVWATEEAPENVHELRPRQVEGQLEAAPLPEGSPLEEVGPVDPGKLEPAADVLAKVAAEHPGLVEASGKNGAGLAGQAAAHLQQVAERSGVQDREDRADVRLLQKDAKSLVNVLQLLRDRKRTRARIKDLSSELKEERDSLKSLDKLLEEFEERRQDEEPAPPKSGPREPEDLPLPFSEQHPQDPRVPPGFEGVSEESKAINALEPADAELSFDEAAFGAEQARQSAEYAANVAAAETAAAQASAEAEGEAEAAAAAEAAEVEAAYRD